MDQQIMFTDEHLAEQKRERRENLTEWAEAIREDYSESLTYGPKYDRILRERLQDAERALAIGDIDAAGHFLTRCSLRLARIEQRGA